MQKVVRLTESDLVRIIKRVISEDEENPEDNFYKLLVGFYSKNSKPIPINVRRRMSNFSVIESINQTMMENPPNNYIDEFGYADDILNSTIEIYFPYMDEIDDRYDIIDFMKQEYADIIFDNFYSQQ